VSEKRHKANRRAHSREAARRPSSFIRTIPSAPASHRICWPSRFGASRLRREALAGSCANAPTAGGESHPALKTFVVAGEPARAF